VAAGIDLVNGSRPSGPPEHALDRPDDGSAYPWDEQVPPLGRDATLLAVVPIPGTGTSLAIVGYAIATSPAPEKARPAAARARRPHGSGLRLDHGQRRAWTDGREIELTFQEFELLAFLSAHPAKVFTRADLIEQVWRRAIAPDGQAIARDSRTVDVHVSRVRHKLGPRYGQCLVTEYRVGYQFRPLVP
jgi:DNA-binding winged helix-turn-helix (wHTH) protein